MRTQQMIGWSLVCLVASSGFLPVLSYPSNQQISGPQYQHGQYPGPQYQPQYQPQQQQAEERKFAEKPNSIKKVQALEDRNDLDDLSTNQITDGGFSWSNMIAMFMQMLFNPAGHSGPNKSDSLDTDTGVAPSPWANLLTVGLKILTALLGGGGVGGDGIDKVDNSSPMQFINIVVNLLDALKTSFSHRSLAARSIGKKDSVSEAAVASLTLVKGYVKTMKTADESCMLKYMCEANRECTGDTNGSSSIFCQLGSYVASFMLQRNGLTPFDSYYEAGRRGRSGDDCQQIYLSCNEV
ncbi:uncharacterized protein [Halyomorpha halys]|uniref:uncharacterized protein isoform X2 n=1 Tax=Halyomorpha halys TaxID=286706 RepID=UPI0006D4E349|nr:uncharacterized protein LOC106677714 isoform X2 [Halyomorpha halys]